MVAAAIVLASAVAGCSESTEKNEDENDHPKAITATVISTKHNYPFLRAEEKCIYAF